MPPAIDIQKCSGCGVCDRICPLDVIHFDSEKKIPSAGIAVLVDLSAKVGL